MKYLLGVLATVFILIAAIFWIVTRSDVETGEVEESKTVVTEYADSSAKVVYELHGELVAEEQRQSIRITIDRNQRVIELLDGYQQTVINKKTYSNNSEAFNEFMFGLSRAGFATKQDPEFDSEKGVCPNGNITIYKLVENGEDISRLWGSTCSNNDGSFDGNRRVVKDLFEDQIPDYKQFVDDVKL
jgi:hypothetical protein